MLTGKKEQDGISNDHIFWYIQLLFTDGGHEHTKEIKINFFAFASLLHQSARRVCNVFGGFPIEGVDVKVVNDALRQKIQGNVQKCRIEIRCFPHCLYKRMVSLLSTVQLKSEYKFSDNIQWKSLNFGQKKNQWVKGVIY